ncbi:hypothetical protein GGR56DRAFT_128020 [Xylariaceae sp. FL0804]|nr:hypothetical protein GGR56DRAFT_128020 [Xylariaceae sp. FL0804]
MLALNSEAGFPHLPPPHYGATVPNPEDIARQLALSDSARRMSLASHGQRTGAMRVVKPRSANNSPQALTARRRSLMNDGGNLARRRQQALDHAVFQHFQEPSPSSSSYHADQQVRRQARPSSWHPSSQFQGPNMSVPRDDFTPCYMPTPATYPHQHHHQPRQQQQPDWYYGYQNYPPTPAVYSGQASPASTFSPLSLPYGASCQPQQGCLPPSYDQAALYTPASQCTPGYFNLGGCGSGTTAAAAAEPFPAYSAQAASLVDWNAFAAARGFGPGTTTPPTPDEFPAAAPPPLQQQHQHQHQQQYQHQQYQHHRAAAAPVVEESMIPYHPLDEGQQQQQQPAMAHESEVEDDEEGEILVGMGLYDDPPTMTTTMNVGGKSDADPALDHYRASTSQLLDSTYRSSGKGWKLEEAWEPPASSSSDSDEDEGGSGEEEEEDEDDDDDAAEPDAAAYHQAAWI